MTAVTAVKHGMLTRATACLMVLGIMLAPSTLVASQDRGTFESLNRFKGQLLYVEDPDGHELLVRLTAAVPTELFVRVGGIERRLPLDRISRVYLHGRDSLRNGALKGGALGAVLGMFACQGGRSDCPIAGVTVASTLAYGALGSWIDARHGGRQLVYRAR